MCVCVVCKRERESVCVCDNPALSYVTDARTASEHIIIRLIKQETALLQVHTHARIQHTDTPALKRAAWCT